MAQPRAFLGNDQVGYEFRFNPDSVSWGYEEAAPPQETLGGRVVQLCSVRVTDMTLTASAGSRRELQRMAESVQQIMEWTIDNQRPVNLKVPSRGWNFRVYVRTLPRAGWSVTTVAYPYQLTLAIDEDLGIATQQVLRGELDRLAAGIGYSPLYHGGSPSDFLSIVNEVTASGGSPLAQSLDPGSTTGTTPLGPLPTPNTAQTATVIAAAQSVLGKPYIFGAAGPNAFDCSGLTLWCWEKVGVHMAHFAATQATEFPAVPESQLQPGDLVFFYTPIHHVALYVGNDQMIQAPHVGSYVQYGRYSTYPDHHGAVRPGGHR